MMNELIQTLYWRNIWIIALVAVPFILLLLHYLQQQRQWRQLADEALLPWLQTQNKATKKRPPFILLGLTWLCFCIALAGPRLVDWLPPEQQAEPASLIVVLDLSASMNARDAYPSRKAQAIQWLEQSLKSKPAHLKIGIVLFAGHAFNLMPPTLDKIIIEHFISQLNHLPLPTLGNDLTAALSLAKQQFKTQDLAQHIALLTDGDLSQEQQNRADAFVKDQLKKQSLSIIGVGANKAVKLPKENGGFVLLNGRPVQSSLQTTWLKQLALLPHVSYQAIEQVKLQRLNQTLNLASARLNQQAQQHVIWHELFPYPLALGLLFLIMSLWKSSRQYSTQLMLSGFIFSVLLSHSPNSQANDTERFKQATNALTTLNYKQVQTLFSQIDTAIAAYGEGVACYRQDDFKCAANAFSKASWQADNKKLKAHAVFNLANSYFFLGDYDQAAVLFQDSEYLGFNSTLARRNLAFSKVMQQAVQQRVKDIKEIFRRAKWRAAVAGNEPPTLSNIVSTQNNLSIKRKDKAQYFLMRQAMAQHVNQQFGIKNNNSNASSQWIKTEHVANQSTAQLLKRLLEMELALPASLNEPQTIEGQRRW